MPNKDERLQILKLLEEGKITAQEATELLKALNPAGNSTPSSSDNEPAQPRWLRVYVTDKESGKQRARMNVPLGLVNIGLKMGARFVPDLSYNSLLQKIELANQTGERGKIFDITNETGELVEIFIE